VSLFHRSERRDAALLALGTLEGEERARALVHLAWCPRCRTEHDEAQALLGRIVDDPWRAHVRAAEVPVPLPFLVARVEQRIDQVRGRRRALRRFGLALALPAAAALALSVGLPWLRRLSSPAPSPEAPMVSAAAFDRLERNVAREQAARYLGDAHDVLATVAASPRDCDRGQARVDVEAESRRSRVLLARRALLVGEGQEESAVASAQPVLDDVEEILREVASMEGCARFRDVERLQAEISRRHLLMKMRLMQRELLG
jgi:hypothetical protein